MIRKIFNPTLPGLSKTLEQPNNLEFKNIQCFKYADYNHVWNRCDNDYVRYILSQIPIFNKHKYVLIDLKVHNLKIGETPCLPGWHLDGSINPKRLPKQPEVMTLFVIGTTARTEFLAKQITLDIPDRYNFAMMSKFGAQLIPKTYPVFTIPSCTFVTYTDSYFHRGSAASISECRLLIRTTETDIIEPQNRTYTPYTHHKSF